MLGCLEAFLKSGLERKFCDLGRIGYWGSLTGKKVDFGFDGARSYETYIWGHETYSGARDLYRG